MKRRRVLTLLASAGAGLCLPTLFAVSTERRFFRWQGRALGAKAQILLDGLDGSDAQFLTRQCQAEIERLEAMFSLYRKDSLLVRLNRSGRINGPPQEFIELCSRALSYSRLTEGIFDPTIQPLWRVIAAAAGEDSRKRQHLLRDSKAALRLVDFRQLQIEPGYVKFGQPGMQMTLNGIAQGYITDRIAELLSVFGMRSIFLDIGEQRALGAKASGEPWQVGLQHPEVESELIATTPLSHGALATSAGSSLVFPNLDYSNHLLHPLTGTSTHYWRSLSILAPTATEADALSTAFSLMPIQKISELLPDTRVEKLIALPADSDQAVYLG